MTPLMGAGKSGNSKRENSPGESGIAKIMECDFHCSRSSMPSSLRARALQLQGLTAVGLPASRFQGFRTSSAANARGVAQVYSSLPAEVLRPRASGL